MANIQIADLSLTGSDLFLDSESFMEELTEYEISDINGGITPVTPYAIASSEVCVSVAAAIINEIIN